jgi:hypothetical protein
MAAIGALAPAGQAAAAAAQRAASADAPHRVAPAVQGLRRARPRPARARARARQVRQEACVCMCVKIRARVCAPQCVRGRHDASAGMCCACVSALLRADLPRDLVQEEAVDR